MSAEEPTQACSFAGDAPPSPPIEPDPLDCCGEGCVNCIFDIYDAALERYETELQAWRDRHPGDASND